MSEPSKAIAAPERPTPATRRGGTLRQLLEMIRFSHTLFALPFALLGALLAWRAEPPVELAPWPRQLLGVLLCMVFSRTAAMAFNRLADHALDARNPRTAGRHLPAGLLSRTTVVLLTLASAAGFVASTGLFWPNPWPLALALPVLAWLLGYSYAKRFTALAHFWLGAALMAAPVAAWLAIRGELSAAPCVLGGAVLSWVAGFDIIYACQDVDFDRREGLRSVPARLGVAGALRVAAACHLATLACLAALPWFYPALGWVYGAGVAGAAVLLAVEHALVRADDLSRVNQAFFQVNAVLSVGLLVVSAVDLLT